MSLRIFSWRDCAGRRFFLTVAVMLAALAALEAGARFLGVEVPLITIGGPR